MVKRAPPASPERYLSVSSDTRDTECLDCKGIGYIRVAPRVYGDCTCRHGKVPPRGEFPRQWRVIHGASPECRDGTFEQALSTFYRWRATMPNLPARDDVPVWDGDLGTFTTVGAMPARDLTE